MTPYKSLSGKPSGVSAFEIGKDYIGVQFNSGAIYKYSYSSCGKRMTEKMKALAKSSKGLSTYISRYQPDYE